MFLASKFPVLSIGISDDKCQVGFLSALPNTLKYLTAPVIANHTCLQKQVLKVGNKTLPDFLLIPSSPPVNIFAS